jgi:hypothetical protein
MGIARDLATQIGKSALMAIPAVRRWRLRGTRTSHDINDFDQYLRENAFLGLDHLTEYGGGVAGKSICEIGPGDFLSSGLSMLAAGAAKYTALDKFPGNYSGEVAKQVYRRIAENWARFYPDKAWPSSLKAEGFPEAYPDLVATLPKSIEEVRLAQKFDIFCSFQVAEHVSDIFAFAAAHNEFLKPAGVAVHRVDFGPHDVWSAYRDPTTFLRFPDLLWKMTGANRGIPNRRRHNEFLDAFAKADLETEVLFLEHFDESAVEYEKIHKQFHKMPKESVLVKTAVYRLRRK